MGSLVAYSILLVPAVHSGLLWHRWSHHGVFLEFLLMLAGVPVFEGEFRDGGLVQLAFAECNQLQILIVSRLS